MNWGIKDENVKNMLWNERCRKDLIASQRNAIPRWAMTREVLEKNVLTQPINPREDRFLSSGPSLLASLSQYIAEDNHSEGAAYVRSFSALRRLKTSRPNLCSQGRRAMSAGVADRITSAAQKERIHSAIPAALKQPPQTTQQNSAASAEEQPPLHVKVPAAVAVADPNKKKSAETPPSAVEPKILSQPRPGTAMMLRPTTTAMQHRPPTGASTSSALDSYQSSGGTRPTTAMFRKMVSTTDVYYGWQPTCVTPQWEDKRFHHPLSHSDVTRMHIGK